MFVRLVVCAHMLSLYVYVTISEVRGHSNPDAVWVYSRPWCLSRYISRTCQTCLFAPQSWWTTATFSSWTRMTTTIPTPSCTSRNPSPAEQPSPSASSTPSCPRWVTCLRGKSALFSKWAVGFRTQLVLFHFSWVKGPVEDAKYLSNYGSRW